MAEKYLWLILLADGLLWLRSSLGKFPPEKFIGSLGQVLEKFASKNPFPWYKDFLENAAIPNAEVFGLLTFWGEFFTALAVTGASLFLLLKSAKSRPVLILLLLGLGGGMFLNGTFWLASGWTSPSTDSLNLLMFTLELIGFVYIFKLLRR